MPRNKYSTTTTEQSDAAIDLNQSAMGGTDQWELKNIASEEDSSASLHLADLPPEDSNLYYVDGEPPFHVDPWNEYYPHSTESEEHDNALASAVDEHVSESIMPDTNDTSKKRRSNIPVERDAKKVKITQADLNATDIIGKAKHADLMVVTSRLEQRPKQMILLISEAHKTADYLRSEIAVLKEISEKDRCAFNVSKAQLEQDQKELEDAKAKFEQYSIGFTRKCKELMQVRDHLAMANTTLAQDREQLARDRAQLAQDREQLARDRAQIAQLVCDKVDRELCMIELRAVRAKMQSGDPDVSLHQRIYELFKVGTKSNVVTQTNTDRTTQADNTTSTLSNDARPSLSGC